MDDILVPANAGPPGKMAVKLGREREICLSDEAYSKLSIVIPNSGGDNTVEQDNLKSCGHIH